MPRRCVHPNIRVALSPAECADALKVSYDRCILPEILAGRLGPVYASPTGSKRRILVRDLERWIEETWLPSGVSKNG
jgi:hypothetical protein